MHVCVPLCVCVCCVCHCVATYVQVHSSMWYNDSDFHDTDPIHELHLHKYIVQLCFSRAYLQTAH